ncbi:restriction endonuclease subunit S [Nonomuraea cavernae]|nr:restriction endonuclease subunit S [Nonomuraea cavernae]MCA2189441.1 restriction endonuclease subunit S [Nonomuraea cavernae]
MVPFLPMENVWPGARLDLSQVRPKSAVAVGYTRFQSGDIVVPKITPTFEASRSVLIPALPNGVGAGTTELHVVRPGPEIEPRYLLYIFHSHNFLKRGEAEMYGVAGQKRVPDELIRDWPLDLPSIEEQGRIADFLDAETARIDQIAATQRAAKKVLLERRAAVVFCAVTGSSHQDRIPSTLAWVDNLPSNWKAVRLSHVARMGSGHTPSRNKPEWWIDCTIPWITTGEVSQMRSDRLEVITETREKISRIGLANSSAEVHPKGTVVLCRTAASAGYSAVMGRDMATSQDIATWTCGPELDPFFLLWCLRAMRTDLLQRLATGSTHKTIYMPDLQALRIPLPSVDQQRHIVSTIRSSNAAIDSAIDVIDRQLALLFERRQALITSAVTGQIEVTTAQGPTQPSGVST